LLLGLRQALQPAEWLYPLRLVLLRVLRRQGQQADQELR
jgi:hypothetical protein